VLVVTEARQLLEKSLGLYGSLGLPRFIGLVASSLGDVVRTEGNLTLARELLNEALTRIAAVDRKLAITGSLDFAAHLALGERTVRGRRATRGRCRTPARYMRRVRVAGRTPVARALAHGCA
jgi:hypothetical protein